MSNNNFNLGNTLQKYLQESGNFSAEAIESAAVNVAEPVNTTPQKDDLDGDDGYDYDAVIRNINKKHKEAQEQKKKTSDIPIIDQPVNPEVTPTTPVSTTVEAPAPTVEPEAPVVESTPSVPEPNGEVYNIPNTGSAEAVDEYDDYEDYSSDSDVSNIKIDLSGDDEDEMPALKVEAPKAPVESKKEFVPSPVEAPVKEEIKPEPASEPKAIEPTPTPTATETVSAAPLTREEREKQIREKKALEEQLERQRIEAAEREQELREQLERERNSKPSFFTKLFGKKSVPVNTTPVIDEEDLPTVQNPIPAKEKNVKPAELKKEKPAKPSKEPKRQQVTRSRDVSRDKLEELALYDQKLHCKNANAFSLEVDLTSVPRKDSLVFIYCDVNNLKKINDSVGHSGGDALLSACSGKMIERFGAGQVYRIGGDEFVILYHPNGDVTPVEMLLETDLTALAKENPLYSFSYGYEVSDGDLTMELLRKSADKKMYSYKENYKKTHQAEIPKDESLKVVKNVVASTLQEIKENDEEVSNIFIVTMSNRLIIFDTTVDFYDKITEGEIVSTGPNAIKYSIITYEDSSYSILTDDNELESPWPIFKALDNDIRNAPQFGPRDVRRHKELATFAEIYIG